MSRALLFSGSQRRGSFNSRLLAHLADGLAGRLDVDMLDDADLPLYNQDLEDDAEVVERVAALHARFSRARGMIVASPEYNSLPTPYLKNTIDWVSRLPRIRPGLTSPFYGRPLLLCSASTGWSGGAIGLTATRTLFAYLGAVVLGEQISVPYADQSWTGTAYAFDPAFQAYIDGVLSRFIGMATPLVSLVAR